VPWFKIGQSHPDAPPITIEHLLTHTAGLPRGLGFPYWTTTDFPTEEDARKRLPEQRTALPTETSWKYSNLGWRWRGGGRRGGRPAIRAIRHERILKPLWNDRTFVKTPPKDEPAWPPATPAGCPRDRATETPFTDGRWITPAANMTTSVTDLARFAMLQFRDGPAAGAQVLRGSTLREMHRVHWLEPDWVAGWGLGFRLMRENGRTLVGSRRPAARLSHAAAALPGRPHRRHRDDQRRGRRADCRRLSRVRVGGPGHRQGRRSAGQGWSRRPAGNATSASTGAPAPTPRCWSSTAAWR
jgi:CubicO group peptidase (beta-lactamase class C family)